MSRIQKQFICFYLGSLKREKMAKKITKKSLNIQSIELMILIVQNLELLRVLPKTKKNKNSVIEYHKELLKELEGLKNKL